MNFSMLYDMASSHLADERIQIERSRDRLKVIIPGSKRRRTLILIGVWLIFWAAMFALQVFLFYAVIHTLVKESNGGGQAILLLIPMTLFFLFWIARGLFVIYLLLQRLFGSEIIELTPESLQITRQILNRQKVEAYALDNIHEIRLARVTRVPIIFTRPVISAFEIPVTGSVGFVYGSQRISFGIDLDYQEARKIIGLMMSRFSRWK